MRDNDIQPQAHANDIFSKIDWWVSLALKAILVIGAILEAAQGNWLNFTTTLGVVIIASIPLMVGYRYHVIIPSEFEILAVLFVYASLFLGELQGFYTIYWWWDILLHTSSGMILGIFGFLLVYVINEREDLSIDMKPSFVAMFAFMFSLGMGTIWEIFEFSLDQLLTMNTQQGGLTDTMGDLIVDAVGALIISLYGYAYLRTPKQDSFIERWIDHYLSLNKKISKMRD